MGFALSPIAGGPVARVRKRAFSTAFMQAYDLGTALRSLASLTHYFGVANTEG